MMTNYLKENNGKLLDWPENLLDLNPI